MYQLFEDGSDRISNRVKSIIENEFNYRINCIKIINDDILQDVCNLLYMDLLNTGIVRKVNMELEKYNILFTGLSFDYGVDRETIHLLMITSPSSSITISDKFDENIPVL